MVEKHHPATADHEPGAEWPVTAIQFTDNSVQ